MFDIECSDADIQCTRSSVRYTIAICDGRCAISSPPWNHTCSNPSSKETILEAGNSVRDAIDVLRAHGNVSGAFFGRVELHLMRSDHRDNMARLVRPQVNSSIHVSRIQGLFTSLADVYFNGYGRSLVLDSLRYAWAADVSAPNARGVKQV